MIFIKAPNQLIHTKGVDLEKEKATSVSATLTGYLLAHPALLSHRDTKDGKGGIVMLPDGPCLISSWPISDSNYHLPMHGTYVVGRYFNKAEQDQFSRAPRAVEAHSLEELLSEAVAALPEELKQAAKIAVDDGVARLPAVCAERIVLSHVLANLLSNAAQAVTRSGRRPGRIEIAGGLDADGRNVYLDVRDDGDGIESEALGRIFERDCPTRRSDALHEGLHWCANAVASMQGRLSAESAGRRSRRLFALDPAGARRTSENEGRLICPRNRA